MLNQKIVRPEHIINEKDNYQLYLKPNNYMVAIQKVLQYWTIALVSNTLSNVAI